jgi:hypothetical protein
MKRQSKIATALFQIAVVAFFFATTSAYGACCFDSGEEAPVSVAPCHTADEDDSSESHGECCFMCAPMVTPDQALKNDLVTPAGMNPRGHESLAWNGIDPPFRPPIHHLS